MEAYGAQRNLAPTAEKFLQTLYLVANRTFLRYLGHSPAGSHVATVLLLLLQGAFVSWVSGTVSRVFT